MKHDKKYMWLDLCRGLSALAVLAGHLRNAIFIDFSQLNESSFVEKIFYFTTSLGHQAVMVFFVLSGFFVGGSILNHKNNFKFKNYLVARLSRLWVVLIPALFFTALIDQVSNFYLPGLIEGGFYELLSSGPNNNYSSSILTFLGNITFLQTTYVPLFGTNGALWSLANEFCYYMLFPMIMIIIGKIQCSFIHKVVFSILTLIYIIFFAHHFLYGFIIWLFGVAVYIIYTRIDKNYNFWFFLFSAILFCFSLINSKIDIIKDLLGFSNTTNLIVGFSFAIFLISIKNKNIHGQLEKNIILFSQWLSDISYTLYVFHFPMVLLIFSVFYSDNQIVFGFAGIMQYLFWMALIIAFSYLMWSLFEKNTYKVRNFINSKINQ